MPTPGDGLNRCTVGSCSACTTPCRVAVTRPGAINSSFQLEERIDSSLKMEKINSLNSQETIDNNFQLEKINNINSKLKLESFRKYQLEKMNMISLVKEANSVCKT